MTPEQLSDILSMPQYNRRAMEIALENQKSSDKWWDLQSAVMEYQTKMAIWEAGQNMLMLFDTYPHEIETIELMVSTDTEQGSTSVSQSMLVNGDICEDSYRELDNDTLDRMTSVDDQKVFKKTVISLTSCFNDRMLSHFHMVELAFKNEFSSAAQVRGMIKNFAGEADAGIKALLLGELAEKSRGDRNGAKPKPGI